MTSVVPCRGRPPGAPPPIMLLAPARSYSSLVVSMLGQHPAVYGFPELLLFSAPTLGNILDQTADGSFNHFRRSGLLRAVAQLVVGGQNADDVAQASAWLEQRRHWYGYEMFDFLLERVAPLIGCEKSPETVGSNAAIQRAIVAYPLARFIHLTRHPASAIPSMARTWRRGLPVGAPHVAYAATRWCDNHRRILEIARCLGPARTLMIRGEEFVRDPAAAVSTCAEWLALDPLAAEDPHTLHPERSPYAAVGPPNAPGGLDRNFLHDATLKRNRGLPATSVDALRLPRDLRDRVLVTARRLGYEEA